MLRAVLEALDAAGRPLCSVELARELDLDAGVVSGMLGTLVARGRVQASQADQAAGPDAVCATCPASGACYIMRDGVAVTYAPVAAASLPGAASLARIAGVGDSLPLGRDLAAAACGCHR